MLSITHASMAHQVVKPFSTISGFYMGGVSVREIRILNQTSPCWFSLDVD